MSAALPESLPEAPRLRALPIPDTEPAPDPEPYDGRRARVGQQPPDVTGARCAQPTLGLALVSTPADELDRPQVSFAPQPTATSDLPNPQAWAGRMVQAVLEVLSGVRPVAQLVRWTSGDVYATLHRRAALNAGRPRPARRDMVRSVHVGRPADGVVEACAVVVRRGRVQAVALRLEGLDGRWQMTALELG